MVGGRDGCRCRGMQEQPFGGHLKTPSTTVWCGWCGFGGWCGGCSGWVVEAWCGWLWYGGGFMVQMWQFWWLVVAGIGGVVVVVGIGGVVVVRFVVVGWCCGGDWCGWQCGWWQ